MRKDNIREKQKLRRGVSTSVRTAMIGAIASFEENFGYLWGHDKDGELTPEEKKMDELWQKTRTEILDKGNKCLEIAVNHVNTCNIQGYRGFYDKLK